MLAPLSRLDAAFTSAGMTAAMLAGSKHDKPACLSVVHYIQGIFTPIFAPPLLYDSFAGLTAAMLAGRKP